MLKGSDSHKCEKKLNLKFQLFVRSPVPITAVEIGFSQLNYSVLENEHSVQLKLQKVGQNAVEVSVELSTLDGTAKGS